MLVGPEALLEANATVGPGGNEYKTPCAVAAVLNHLNLL
jgi:hypothetical protein